MHILIMLLFFFLFTKSNYDSLRCFAAIRDLGVTFVAIVVWSGGDQLTAMDILVLPPPPAMFSAVG